MEKQLNNSILITGCSTGIGAALVMKFLKQGFLVFGSIRDKKMEVPLKKKYGVNFVPLVFDVTNYSQISKAYKKVKLTLKGANLGILINNAGIAKLGPVELISSEEFDLHLKTMVLGTFNCVQIFLPLLGAKNKISPGKVINISSGGGSIGQPFMASYCSSKHALEGFSESLRRELLIYGIKVIIVAPRAFRTEIWDKSNIDGRTVDFKKTVYNQAFNKFTIFIKGLSEQGQDVQVLAQKIYKISSLKNPKVKYSMGPSGVQFYLIRTLPKKLIDKILGKFFLLI
jgi:NAD(P)-dependent dehydrogenase (short-subunit alcohol dehydrogenase family)